VQGLISQIQAGLTDAHNHIWIDPDQSLANAPYLNDEKKIIAELVSYNLSGGKTILDCQPYGCGRDGKKLLDLANHSGVQIITSTGYHLRRYYPKDFWLFKASAEDAKDLFLEELRTGLSECPAVQAGFIKIAFEDTVEKSPFSLIEGAAEAAIVSGSSLLVHTEQGKDTQNIIQLMLSLGVPKNKLVMCHMDKRAELALREAIAQEGILLEYDTFFRPKYKPDTNVWPLLESMVKNGYEKNIALGLDFADKNLWHSYGGKPGLNSITEIIIPRLEIIGINKSIIKRLTGSNIVRSLSFV